MRHDVRGLAAYGADGVAIVAVVEEDGIVLVEGLELLRSACTSAVIGLAVADGEILVLAAGDSAEGDCCNN